MSSTSWNIAIGVALAVGLLLVGISRAMLRPPREKPPSEIAWPQLVDDTLTGADASVRREIVERLSIVRNDWSRSILQRARSEEPDAQIRSQIEAALKS